MPYLYHTDEDRRAMLDALGLDSIEELFDQIPAEFHVDGPLPIGRGLTEPEAYRLFAGLGTKNNPAGDMTSFLGGGIYDHVVPSVVGNLSSRPELATAYTPYQPEVSQGTLQIIFEFQSHIVRLTGMDVANASMYDAASALAEAALLAAKVKRRDAVIVPENLNPRYRAVLNRYVCGQNIHVRRVACTDNGDIDQAGLSEALGDDVAAVMVQTPNYFGVLERPWDYQEKVHDCGALLIAAVDPISLGVVRPPGSYGADVVLGEGQSLGNHMNFGGPLLGFMAARRELIRKMPGRIVSKTTDSDGSEAYVLTLQTREQHIRREKATSNICTNQGLMATRATIYLSLLGEAGFTELGRLCAAGAQRLAAKIRKCPGYSLRYGGPFFREFVVNCRVPAEEVTALARERDILAGIPLEKYYGEAARNQLLVATTEKHTDEDYDALCDVLRSV